MKYVGSKNRLSKDILPLILKNRKPGQWYVEPFVGGANLIDKVKGNRIGADANEYLIELLKAIQANWLPELKITEDIYNDIKKNKDDYPKRIVAFAGFCMSFGAKWFGGFSRDNKKGRSYFNEGVNSLKKQKQNIDSVDFICCDYKQLNIPANSIIYCDPPYKDCCKSYVSFDFNSSEFWGWCRNRVNEGHEVFVSEYQAPEDFVCIFKKELKVGIDNTHNKDKMNTEKLFIHKSQYDKQR